MGICRIRATHVFIVVGVFLAAINFGTQHWSDDYCRILQDSQNVLADSVDKAYGEYFSWSGRFTVIALTYFFLSLSYLKAPHLFDVVNSLVFIGLLIGIFRLSQGRMPSREDGLAIALLFFLVWHGVGTIGSVVLWKTGAINYLWVVTAGIWLLVPFADYVFYNKLHAMSVQRIILSVVMVAICGLGLENFTVTVLFAQLLTFFIYFRRTGKYFSASTLSVPAVLMGAATLCLLFSPGNQVRVAAVRLETGDTGDLISKVIPFTKDFILVYARSWLTYVFLFLFWRVKDRDARFCALAWFMLSLFSCYVLIGAPGIQTGGRRNFASEVILLVGLSVLLNRALSGEAFSPKFVRITAYASLITTITTSVMLVLFNYRISQTVDIRQRIVAETKDKSGTGIVVFPPLDLPFFGLDRRVEYAKRMFFFSDATKEFSQCQSKFYGLKDMAIDVDRGRMK